MTISVRSFVPSVFEQEAHEPVVGMRARREQLAALARTARQARRRAVAGTARAARGVRRPRACRCPPGRRTTRHARGGPLRAPTAGARRRAAARAGAVSSRARARCSAAAARWRARATIFGGRPMHRSRGSARARRRRAPGRRRARARRIRRARVRCGRARGRARACVRGPAARRGRATASGPGCTPTTRRSSVGDQRRIQPAPAALVGEAGIGEAIATAPTRRAAARAAMVSRTCCARAANISSSSVSADAGSCDGIEQQLADALGQRRAARFARAHHFGAASPCNASRSALSTVDLPAPSPPSSVMRRGCVDGSGRSLRAIPCAIARHVRAPRGLVFGVVLAEDVAPAAIAHGDEVQRLAARRIGGRAQRVDARHRDRRRRQARALVGVVGRVGLQVRACGCCRRTRCPCRR